MREERKVGTLGTRGGEAGRKPSPAIKEQRDSNCGQQLPMRWAAGSLELKSVSASFSSGSSCDPGRGEESTIAG